MAPSIPLVNTFLCKVASRCNLDCDYCYLYHHVDQSWRERPRFMSDEIVAAFARNLADYVSITKLDQVTVPPRLFRIGRKHRPDVEIDHQRPRRFSSPADGGFDLRYGAHP